ncbi:MAG: DUF2955 domain-containing protein [Candidatus Accumulibacter sp.]|uniref:hypothetical protein n=1 Tax=Accumulibacter sp. TaxID=2053492 RepID=UPI001A5786E9|nr:hypothetical protein [Accumulibacter sp.]MBL8395292.1 DUF2955 domain-containing protein [Accumulibacter sp.]
MNRADKAVLRLAIGLGLAVLIAYGGLALSMPYLVLLVVVMVLCKPGPPIPLAKAAIIALLLAVLLVAGVLMVPLLENYPLSGVVLTGAILYALFFLGMRSGNPLTVLLVVTFTLIPVAGVAEQALVTLISLTMALGIGVGGLVSSISHAFFPDHERSGNKEAKTPGASRETAGWIALRGTLVVLPVFVLALTDPSFYLAAIMNTVTLGQQACSTDTGSAGRELVGSTLMGALMAIVVWFGLSLWPSLWMLMLWMMAAAFWVGARLFAVKATAFPPTFWKTSLTTMLVLLGPAIEDSASGTGVFVASISRIGLYVGVALYAWVTVWALERWRASRSEALFFNRG